MSGVARYSGVIALREARTARLGLGWVATVCCCGRDALSSRPAASSHHPYRQLSQRELVPRVSTRKGGGWKLGNSEPIAWAGPSCRICADAAFPDRGTVIGAGHRGPQLGELAHDRIEAGQYGGGLGRTSLPQRAVRIFQIVGPLRARPGPLGRLGLPDLLGDACVGRPLMAILGRSNSLGARSGGRIVHHPQHVLERLQETGRLGLGHDGFSRT